MGQSGVLREAACKDTLHVQTEFGQIAFQPRPRPKLLGNLELVNGDQIGTPVFKNRDPNSLFHFEVEQSSLTIN